MTMPSALSKVASRYFLGAQPPLLGLGGEYAVEELRHPNSNRDTAELRSILLERVVRITV
jgi:hypothetical protein